MSLLHHYHDESDYETYETRRDSYIRCVEEDPLVSIAEERNVHYDNYMLTAKEFCEKYGL